MSVDFELDGRQVSVADSACSLLESLRDELGVRSPKDGCSPQGQCGCCTVLVDGRPRVACVTPVARVRGRRVTTVDGVDDATRWAEAFCSTGASQCGFCTPGIVVRLSALADEQLVDRAAVDKALLAHLCRCTGWQTIREACVAVAERAETPASESRALDAASRRAAFEGGAAQAVGPDVALGRGGFADDTAPPDALVAVRDAAGEWVVAESLSEARAVAGKVQGRRTTSPPQWPVDRPEGSWQRTLQTTWVEPAYLEPDASWCLPGGEPTSPLGNGGAFGGKVDTEVAEVARRLADEHGRPVRVLSSREDTVRFGAKRPPMAIGIGRDGRGIVRIARPGPADDESVLRERIATVAPLVEVEFVDVAGPPVSASLRGAGWAEVAAVVASLDDADGISGAVASPGGSSASAVIERDGSIGVRVDCGDPLDEVVLRSYCIGAAHMALGMVRSESIALDADARPLDLTVRSFGILRAGDMPHVDVEIVHSDREPVNGSDAVFSAVLGAAWRHARFPERLPFVERL